MPPYYKRLGRDALLSWDDVLAVQSLYGETLRRARPCALTRPLRPTPHPPGTPKARTPALQIGFPPPKRRKLASPSLVLSDLQLQARLKEKPRLPLCCFPMPGL